MPEPQVIIGILFGAVAIAAAAVLLLCYRRAEQGTALVRSGWGGTRVSFSGMLAFPVIHRLETVNLTIKRVDVIKTGQDRLQTKDGVQLDARVAFILRVEPIDEEVLTVARAFGAERTHSNEAVTEIFEPAFHDAVVQLAKNRDYREIYDDTDSFRDAILKAIGPNLSGYVLDNVAFDHLAKPADEEQLAAPSPQFPWKNGSHGESVASHKSSEKPA